MTRRADSRLTNSRPCRGPAVLAPPAGLEPAPYGLEVGQRLSEPSRGVPLSLVRFGTSSAWWRPVVPVSRGGMTSGMTGALYCLPALVLQGSGSIGARRTGVRAVGGRERGHPAVEPHDMTPSQPTDPSRQPKPS